MVTGVCGKWRADGEAGEPWGWGQGRPLSGDREKERGLSGAHQEFADLEGEVGGAGEMKIKRNREKSAWQRSTGQVSEGHRI